MGIRSLIQKVVYGQGNTPLPNGILITVFLLIVCNGMITTNVFPYLPELVKVFGATEIEAAKKAGFMASAMFLMKIFSSIMWGFICDKFGTKLSLLLSGTGLVISTLMFGFSINYVWAIIARSLQGLCMGLIIIAKAIVSEVADDTNIATGFSIMFSASNFGFIIGPTIAGYLVFPVTKYPKFFTKGSFFDVFKVFLPNFICASGLLASLLVTVCLLPKSKSSSKEQDVIVQDDNEILQNSIIDSDINLNYTRENKTERSRLIGSTQSINQSGLLKHFVQIKNSKLGKLLGNKDFLLTNLIYGLHSMVAMGHNELFPVFAATPLEYKGLGMTTSDIGLLYLIISVVLLIVNSTLLNKLFNKFGSKKVVCVSSILFGALVLLVPTVSLIKIRSTLWLAAWVNQTLVRITISAGYLAINIFINNSVESDMLGLANGLAMSTASVGSSIGAVIFGNAFTWSMKNVENAQRGRTTAVFPINQYFAFVLMAVMSVLVFFIGVCIPENLNKKRAKSDRHNTPVVVTKTYFRFK